MRLSEVLRYTVFPDSHGQHDLVARAVDFHDAHTDIFIFDGDIFNGPESAGLVRLIRSLGSRAVAVSGNHCWVTRNATADEDDEMVAVWAEQVWPGYEERSLLSYGIHQTHRWLEDARALREVMRASGDLEWLRGMPPYLETPEFIAVHSGPELDKPWAQQALYLDGASQPEQRLYEEPPQIFSGRLGTVLDIPTFVDERKFITGHLHYTLPIEARITQRKICLASPLDKGAPLYTWTSEDNKIHEHTF